MAQDHCPTLPGHFAGEYRAYMAAYPHFMDTDDERFDHAFDFVSTHSEAPLDDDGELHTECIREWTYELMEAVGHPYQSNPSPSVWRWVAGVAMATIGVVGIVQGLRARD